MTKFEAKARFGYYILLGAAFFIGCYFLINLIFNSLAISNPFLHYLITIAIIALGIRLFALVSVKTWKKNDRER